jgi:O-antigen/teichoic acid export membrane protein
MKEQNLGKKVASEAIVSFGGMSTGSIFRYLFSIFMARWLGPQMLGLYSLGNAVTRIGEIFAIMGLDNGVLRFVSREDRNSSNAESSIYASIKMGFISSIIIAITLYYSAEWIVLKFLTEDPFLIKIIKFYAFTLPFTVITLIASFATQGFKVLKYKIFVNQIINPAVLLVSMVASYLIFGSKAAILIPTFLSAVIGMVFILVFLKKFITLDFKKIISTPFNTKILKFSIPLMFVSAIGIIMHWIDILMLGIFSDASAVGMYHPIERTAGLIRMILFAFAGIFAPLFSQYFYEKNSEKMTEIYQLSTKWIFVASLPLFIFLMLFSNQMLMLFGNEFDNGLALKILSIGIMIQAFFGLGSSSLTMSGFSNLNLLNVLVALTVNIIMNIILIPQYGIIGAASATTIALFIISCLRFLENYYILSLNVFSLKLFKPLLSGILTVGVILFSQRYILNLLDYSSSLLNLSLYLLMAVAFVFIGYFSFYALLGIDKEDRDMIDSLKKRISNQA